MTTLYELLPVVHQSRDAGMGYPLKELLAVIQEQVDGVRADLDQLYADWFIETCQEWVVPYLGDLVGVEAPRARLPVPRRAVANAVRDRRRKGTLAVLEDLARDVADWPARAVEFYKLLAWTQHLDHTRLHRGGTADMRQGDALELAEGPFERLAHTVDVRRCGKFNIPQVGLFVWRLGSYGVTETPAYCLEEAGSQCYTFSVLGNDSPLCNRPRPEQDATHIAEEANLPAPIRRKALGGQYGPGASLAIWAPDWPVKGAPQPLPASLVVAADLADWTYRSPKGTVAVDPVRGRLVFPTGQMPRKGVRVSYCYGFSAAMGGGEYPRALRSPLGHKLYRVGDGEAFTTLAGALSAWIAEREAHPAAVIEAQRSGVFTESLNIVLLAGESLQIRAASGARPVLRLLDLQADLPDAFSISGASGSRFTLDGFLVTGRGLKVYGPEASQEGQGPAPGDLCEVAIRHCTLVPGWGLQCDCGPRHPSEASLELDNTRARIRIERSILGSIFVVADEVKLDPVCIHLSDSILDATGPDLPALGCRTLPAAFATATFLRCTVFGQVLTHSIARAENTLFTGTVRVARRQAGCVRFSHVPAGSRTPRRYHCQPDLAVQALGPMPPEQDRALAQARMAPVFNSQRYGEPAYGQLASACAQEVRRGADDESEMGAFHDLFQPQRAANLRARLDEFIPAGMEAGIFFAN